MSALPPGGVRRRVARALSIVGVMAGRTLAWASIFRKQLLDKPDARFGSYEVVDDRSRASAFL
jgi:hypothetical protein